MAGSHLFIIDDDGRTVHRIGDALPAPATVMAAAANRAVVGHEDGSLHLWDLAGRRYMTRFRELPFPRSLLALSGNGMRAVTCSPRGSAVVWDLQTASPIARFEGGGALTRPEVPLWQQDPFGFAAVAMNAAGDRLVLGENSGRVHILALRDGALVRLAS